jgi:hypothetical protein
MKFDRRNYAGREKLLAFAKDIFGEHPLILHNRALANITKELIGSKASLELTEGIPVGKYPVVDTGNSPM